MRAWIVGNGTSLKDTPLDLIREDSFACNRIHKIYRDVHWRPTYYVRTEPPAQEDTSGPFFDECKLHIELGEKCIFPSAWREVLGEHRNIEYVNTCHHFKYDHLHKKAPKEWHLPMLCDFGTVLTAMMQLAVLKGYDELILVGCDLTGAHFTADYEGSIQTQLWKYAHDVAAKSCPIPVYNATLGGDLEAYPRVRIDDAFAMAPAV